MNLYPESVVLDDLRERCARRTQTAIAKELGFSIAFINDVLHGRRKLTSELIHKMGYIRIVQVQKVEG